MTFLCALKRFFQHCIKTRFNKRFFRPGLSIRPIGIIIFSIFSFRQSDRKFLIRELMYSLFINGF